jgi:hypothetical protein
MAVFAGSGAGQAVDSVYCAMCVPGFVKDRPLSA